MSVLFESATLQDIEAVLSNEVYEATQILEKMERAGKLLGNGHHARQEVCAFAIELLRKRWIEKEKA